MNDRVTTVVVLILTHLAAITLGLALAQHNLWLVR
jgi:hypothetical protein